MESDFPNKISENISIFQEKCLIVNIIQYKLFHDKQYFGNPD